MAKQEIMQYSLDGINYYKKSEYCSKFNISDSEFKNLLSKHIFYKKVNGFEYKYIHISKSNKCTITFTDCKDITTVEKLSRKIINASGCGNYKVTYKSNNGEIVEKGTHQDLLKHKCLYYKLYELQFNNN